MLLRQLEKVIAGFVLKVGKAWRGQDVTRHQYFTISHRKLSLDLAQSNAPTAYVPLGPFDVGYELFSGLLIHGLGRVGLIFILAIRREQLQDFLIFDDIVALRDALIAGEDCRPCDQLVHLVLRLAAEQAIKRVRWLGDDPCRRKRASFGSARLSRLKLSGQNIPIVVAERLCDQLQALTVGGFDSFRL